MNALSIPILMAGGTVIVGSSFDAEEALRRNGYVRCDNFTFRADDVSVYDSARPISNSPLFLP